MIEFSLKPIEASLTITTPSDGTIRLQIGDKKSGITFVELVMTEQQFVNATLRNRAYTETTSAFVRGIDLVGKTMEMKPFNVMLPANTTTENRDEVARDWIKAKCPEGWTPELGLGCQDSFSMAGDHMIVHTTIRRWVEK